MRVVEVRGYTGPVGDDGLVDVYNITVEGTRLYYAGNCLVGNSKRVSLLDVNALLSAGAISNLRDVGLGRVEVTSCPGRRRRSQCESHVIPAAAWWFTLPHCTNPSATRDS